jgi:hypothetical protein
MIDEILVVCVNVTQDHTPESQLDKCSECGVKVWCQFHNMHHKKICIDCFRKMQAQSAVQIAVGIKMEDIRRAQEYIAETQRKEAT